MTRIETILGSRNRVKVLRVLLKKDGLSGREVARIAELSASAANVALTELVDAGAVFRNGTIGKNSFEVNKSHFLINHLARLFEEEAAITNKMFDMARKYINDFPVRTELLGLGLSSDKATLILRPLLNPDNPVLRTLKAALKVEFGVDVVETGSDLAKLTGHSSSRLAIPDKPRDRLPPASRERSLRFFGIREPDDRSGIGGAR